MTTFSLLPFFMIGLLGGLHCIGMCGGIVSAFSAASKPARAFPVAVINVQVSQMLVFENVARIFAYNAGRIGSYAIAGAMVGGIAGSVRSLSKLAAIQIAGYWLANLMLVALGLYLMDVWRGLAHVEAFGQIIWRHIQPLMKLLLPIDNAGKAFALGGLWGWLPCGMVYSVLLTAMFSGSATSGASVMLAFGLGTLPMMLGLGLVGARLRVWAQRRAIRIACGAVVLTFGVLGLLRANGMSAGFMDVFCITPPSITSSVIKSPAGAS
ncbi:MAG: sulfite exporter TauE/SafE family protein [Herminiimonas sp.]|uniref:sulfite exporter TauE/SafE family protein n=1 Tax=Herminiimonas sp. TaxID=1926289 RepID=UPI002727B48A|nr:sulfite exporter TauE/SafE family protein [Herminiimonas sp.]MDO9420912.1 sulfite exporter TauE/SafE family protein [Herminiimonas sp.]